MAEDVLGFRRLFLLADGPSSTVSLLLSCGCVAAPWLRAVSYPSIPELPTQLVLLFRRRFPRVGQSQKVRPGYGWSRGTRLLGGTEDS